MLPFYSAPPPAPAKIDKYAGFIFLLGSNFIVEGTYKDFSPHVRTKARPCSLLTAAPGSGTRLDPPDRLKTGSKVGMLWATCLRKENLDH